MNRLLEELKTKSFGELLASRIRPFFAAAPYNEPWPEELDRAVRNKDSMAVCHRCLLPQRPGDWFCPECGAATGPFNNTMPYLHIFSIGEGLRAGVGPEAHYTRLTVWGYVLAGWAEYSVFAPLFYLRILRNWSQRKAVPPQPANGAGDLAEAAGDGHS